MQVKERVFVMRLHKYSDADLIIHCLTSKGAKLSLFARSALKSKKRFGGGVFEPTHYIEVVYQRKGGSEGGGLCSVSEAQIIKDFSKLRADYPRLQLGLHFVHLVDQIMREGDEHSSQIFDLLGNSLSTLESSQELEKLKLHFEVKLLSSQGVLPIDASEAQLLSLGISEHARIDLSEASTRKLKSTIQSVLREYLPHARPTNLLQDP
jgi:DNA repair protein RecO (recombination protein O)